jgi:hypothetical protein
MSCESRIFGYLLTSSQPILRRRVEQTAFLHETECSRNYTTEITRLKLRSFGFTLTGIINSNLQLILVLIHNCFYEILLI